MKTGKMVLMLALVVAGMARANTVLLSDNFNGITATTGDPSANLADRQSGTVAPVSYTAAGWTWYLVPEVGVSGTSALHGTENGASSSVALEMNWFNGTTTALADGGFTIAFDLNASTLSSGSIGVSFGGDSSWVATPSVTASSFAVSLDGNRWAHLYVAGAEVLSMAVPEFTAGEYHAIQVSYAGDSLADGTAAKLILTVDGTAGVAYPFTMKNYGDPSLNYLHLVTSRWACDFDNLEIRTGSLPACDSPVFTPGGKYISGPTTITLRSATAGASIYYTTDNSIPTASGTAYPNPTTVTVNGGDTVEGNRGRER